MPRRPDRYVLVAALLVLLHLGLRGWALWGSWFYFDDLAFISRATNQPLDAAYLTEPYGDHLMPAGLALAHLLSDLAPFEWLPWAASLLVLQALAGLGMLRLLLSMFGHRWLTVGLLAGYLALVFTLPAGLWWSAGINQLPLLVSLGFGLHAVLAHLRTRRIRSLAAALLWTAFGLAFYERTLLLIGVYAIVGLGWFASGSTPERLREFWRHYRVAVVAFAVLIGGYVACYVGYGLGAAGATTQSWGQLAWNLVMVAFATAAVGGPVTWQAVGAASLADPSTLVQLGSWVALGGLGYYAYRTRTHSGRAWLPLAFMTVCNVVLLTRSIGPDVALDYRYQTEAGALAVIAVGLALMPLRGAREVNAVRPDVPRPYERARYGAMVGVVVLALASVSSVRYVVLWQDGNPSEPFFEHVSTAFDEADRPVPLADIGLPPSLLWAFNYPENTYSHVFRELPAAAGKASYPSISVDNLYAFDDSGRLAPVVITPVRSMVQPGGCGYRLAGARTTVRLDGPVLGTGWWIRLGYASPRAVDVTVTAGERSYQVELPKGLHNLYFQAEGEFSSVVLGHDEGGSRVQDSELCVTSLDLGTPTPVSRSAGSPTPESTSP